MRLSSTLLASVSVLAFAVPLGMSIPVAPPAAVASEPASLTSVIGSAAPVVAEEDNTPRRLYLAVGHGRTPKGKFDPGAIDPRSGVSEVEAGQIVVDAMAAALQGAAGLEVTAESGDHPNVHGTVAFANRTGFDDCIEIHHDQPQAPPGAFAHWHASSPSAGELADHLVNGLGDLGIGIRDDWHRPRSGLYFVRNTSCRAVLVELGPIGAYDAAQLHQIGEALARAYATTLHPVS